MDTPILRGLSKPVPVGFSYGTVSDHNGSVPKLESSHGFLHLATRVDLNKSPTSITLQYTVNVYACIYIYGYGSKFGYGSARGDPDVWNE